jgi:hypothetical protein
MRLSRRSFLRAIGLTAAVAAVDPIAALAAAPAPPAAARPRIPPVAAAKLTAAASWSGSVVEVLLYERALSDADRAEVEQYLNAKYRDAFLGRFLPGVSVAPADRAPVAQFAVDRSGHGRHLQPGLGLDPRDVAGLTGWWKPDPVTGQLARVDGP